MKIDRRTLFLLAAAAPVALRARNARVRPDDRFCFGVGCYIEDRGAVRCISRNTADPPGTISVTFEDWKVAAPLTVVFRGIQAVGFNEWYRGDGSRTCLDGLLDDHKAR